ncbi:MAG: hypothetical protein AAFQ94_30710, partial [Bacteroidota bacterium]
GRPAQPGFLAVAMANHPARLCADFKPKDYSSLPKCQIRTVFYADLSRTTVIDNYELDVKTNESHISKSAQ